MKVVLDTNVWISGLLWHGTPNRILTLVRQGAIEALVTESLLDEIATTLAYSKLQPRLQQLQESPASLWMVVQELTQPCHPLKLVVPGLRDSKDLMVLEAAIGGDAEIIVTGDRDLLVLGNFSGISIMSPQNFLAIGIQTDPGHQK